MKCGSQKAVVIILICTFLFLLADKSEAYSINEQKNILILHSYNEEQDWTRSLTSGMIDTIRDANENYFVSVEYMDWKNYPLEANLKYLYQYYHSKYENKKIDVIIACDDAALSFALENRAELFSDAPIVFCGVNKESLARIDQNQFANYTGVYEIADPTESVKMAYAINPALEKIYLVSDNTDSGTTTAKLFIDKIEAMDQDFQIIRLNYLDFTKLLEFLSKLDDKSIVLYATYNSDANGTILEYNIALKQICRSSAAPVYHMYDFGLKDGVFGGNMTSPRRYGEYAAEMAVRILKGKNADQIPILTADVAKKVVEYQQLERFHISPEAIPADVEILNRKFSFFETYRTLVLIVALIFILLVGYIILLSLYTNKNRRMKQELARKNQDLTSLYDELLNSDEALKDQYEEIISIQQDLRRSEEKFTYLAMHDALTGLRNRRALFLDAAEAFPPDTGGQAALMYLDLDNFKYINDTMGHGFGDEFIKVVSQNLKSVIGESGILYRLGGDEFIALISQAATIDEAERYAVMLMELFHREFEVYSSAMRVSASIGVSLYPDHGETIDELVKAADIAMFKAKETGKNRYAIYEAKMDEDFSNRMILEKHLHTAMKNDEFEIYYQPQVNAVSGVITGMEALLRWKSPELGMVPPLKFIPVAEVTNLIIPLGEWVLDQACDFLKELHKSGHHELTMSVNISVLQIMQSDFHDKVIRILERYELDPRYLELEVTETVLIESFDAVLDKLKMLHDRGIGIALDDFGKGYSSLNYLMRLPISTLKIDKSFVDHISMDTAYKEITSHIIRLGKALGVEIVAEGVEYEEQLEYLKQEKCDKIQGYLFSRPVTKQVLLDLL